MSPGVALFTSVILLALNGFFVAAEFALVASKRYRLEHAAAGGGRAAKAALEGVRELSLMLAGAQLGITLCTLGLGALAEPAIEHLLSPLLHAVGLPDAASHVIALIFALSVVTFLHLVVGEMAPKSWAITDPERSAVLLALPFRAFARVARPVLSVMNAMANAMLRLVKVNPQDQLAQVHGPDELRMLLEQSREHGLLGVEQHRLLTSMLELQGTTVAQVMEPFDQMVTVRRDEGADRIEQVSRDSGRSRLAVLDANDDVCGLVHVREAVRATTTGRPLTAGDLMTSAFTLPASASVTEAVAAMRARQSQLALVRNGAGPTRPVGFVALEDLLEEVIGEFDDETDPVPRGRRMR
ncbi:hemolysin family protein [Micromonospora peucetia]|uniref:Hemolysin family protein n=1 Tax=Micromonospora peucetia TaxID=47871 RepID=A0A1C6U3C5_9ACTN|nr:hemolysin family protein [Micromonospora peucetia]MCX4386000.1 hemolysin family protein [Micromonospora peucetia]WSA33368.1 hemolysin family protein [Micromonospora peucetia]SCL48542.1 Hemolysin, contains CBS domains [Micromonospora peucetia]